MLESEIYDLVIIGGGPGGLTAAIYAMRAVLKTVVIELATPGGQMNLSDMVENWPGTEQIGGFDLSQKFLDHAKSYGAEIRLQEIVGLEPGDKFHLVRLADGSILNAHAVIIATGGSPRKLNIDGEAEYYGKGVSYCAVCDGFFFKNKTVVVIGGGDSAVEEALYLSKLVQKIYLVHRRDALRAGMMLQKELMAKPNIEILWNTIPVAIKADEKGVCSVELQDTKNGERRELSIDGIFVSIGFEPNNKIVPADVEFDANGYVITNEKCEINIPGIYVVGDLRAKFAKQIVTAAADGCTAALAAAEYVERKKAQG